MWDGTKWGSSYPFLWDRIVVVTDHHGLGAMVTGLGWLIPGEVKLFALDELAKAKDWVS